jgi:hypothetical protein
VSVTVAGPPPVFSAALYSFAAVGGELPAGNVVGYVIEFVGSAQFPLPAVADAAVTFVAVVDSVLPAPFANVFDVPLMFHPATPLVSSSMLNEPVAVSCWSVPLAVREPSATLAGGVIPKVPPAQIV